MKTGLERERERVERERERERGTRKRTPLLICMMNKCGVRGFDWDWEGKVDNEGRTVGLRDAYCLRDLVGLLGWLGFKYVTIFLLYSRRARIFLSE